MVVFSVVFSQAYAANKVAIINVQRAIVGTELAKKKIDEVKNKPSFKAYIKDSQTINEEGKQLVKRLQTQGETMSEKQKQELTMQIRSKQNDLKHVLKKLEEQEQSVMQSLMIDMQDKVSQALEEIVEKQGIGLLLHANPQTVLYADEAFDVTNLLTDKLNKLK